MKITSLCSVLASPFSLDCGLDGEYDLERERDRLRDILKVIKSERYFRTIHKFIFEVRNVPSRLRSVGMSHRKNFTRKRLTEK